MTYNMTPESIISGRNEQLGGFLPNAEKPSKAKDPIISHPPIRKRVSGAFGSKQVLRHAIKTCAVLVL